jgi:hypothetical protein
MSNDPLDSAETPQFGEYHYWGKCTVDAYFCVLTKGIGKEPFDAQKHPVDQRRTAITIGIDPIAEMNSKYDVSRDYIAESKEWAGTVLPSIKAIGTSLRELNGKFVHAKLKPTSKYEDKKTGEMKDHTTIEFLAIFADEKACVVDYSLSQGTAPVAAPAQVTPDGTPVNVMEKETALKFLKVLVKKAEGDPAKLTPLMAQYPPVAKFFTIDSPEVMSEMLGYLSSTAAAPF